MTLNGTAGQEWRNWSGSLRFTPGKMAYPGDEGEVIELVRQARANGKKVRPVGTGHSSSPIVNTDGLLISAERMKGLSAYDRERMEATLGPGMAMKEAGDALLGIGMAFPNQGDVNVQRVIGAISTGTHGTGRGLHRLSSMLVGGRLVTADGSVLEFGEGDGHRLLRAVRLSLGALGIFTSITLRLMPACILHRQEWCTTFDLSRERLEDLERVDRRSDFYWYPRSDRVKLRTWSPPGEEPDIPRAKVVKEATGWSGDTLSRERSIRYEEMEYEMPEDEGMECFEEVRERMMAHHRRDVGWRVLVRTVAADDTFLSQSYGRPTVVISIHHNASLPYWGFFQDIEEIFLEHHGRPHWAKKHSLTAERLRPLYPQWGRFISVRRDLDPEGLFLNPYLRSLLGEEA